MSAEDEGETAASRRQDDDVPSPPAAENASVVEDAGCLAPFGGTAGTVGGLVEVLGELADLAQPTVADADSDYELDDFEQLDVGDVLGTNLREEVQQVLARFLRPERVLMRDKLTFVLGIMHMILSSYWLGFSPQSFYRLYTIEAGVLLLLRFTHYRWSHQHYYLLDWCYFGNLLLVMHIWWFPTSVLLAKITFAHAMGPLLFSILAFRNSIVPHSLDKMTSHFMHWYPACVCWATRWYPSNVLAAHLQSSSTARAQWESTSLRDLALLPLLPYLVWAALYYLKVFVVSSNKIQQRGYDTLYKYATANKRSLFGAVVLRAPNSLRPLVYMAAHLLLTMTTMLLNTLWWRSYWANTGFMVCILTASAWSGATFYFDHFAFKYAAMVGLPKRRAGSTLSSGGQQPSESTASDAKKRT